MGDMKSDVSLRELMAMPSHEIDAVLARQMDHVPEKANDTLLSESALWDNTAGDGLRRLTRDEGGEGG